MKQMTTVTNPYPEWQQLASETNCWNCYVLLWRKEQVERHLCDECHSAGLVAINDEGSNDNEQRHVWQ